MKAGTLEIRRQMYEQELEKTVRERTENQKKWEDDKELIRRQERSLEDKKEALIHKKTETENQEHTYQLYQNELEIRKNILKYLDMEERHLLDTDRILENSARKLRELEELRRNLEKEEDFVNYCDRLVNEKIVHEEDTDLFLEQTDLEALRSVLYHATAPEFYRYRENVSGQYIWVTTEVLPCRGCCAQNPWATVLVRNDAQADQLSEELDFSYSHDTLTGLANRSRYEADLRELPHSGYESVVCTYIDVVGMHEVNEHLGHRSGDTLLCCLANAARKFFATSRVYRIRQ